MSTPDTHGQALDALRDWIRSTSEAGNLRQHQPGKRRHETLISVPGDHKLATNISIIVGNHTTSATAFVIRNPDENHSKVHQWLLLRNTKLPGIAYNITTPGDIYLTGKLPTDNVSTEHIDNLIGAIACEADTHFNTLLAMGFRTAMQREWDWRISRGESVANLEPFRHLLEQKDSARGK